MGDDSLRVEIADGVVDVLIDRGDDRNLLTVDMFRRLVALRREPPTGAHVLRLRATGPVFCLGRERRADEPADLREESTALAAVNEALRASPLVSVAEVHGDAAGFGVGLVANADVAIASGQARFWFPEVRIDLAPAVVLAWLPRVVGRKQAFWLAASGAELSADRALELGLVTAVVPSDALETAVDDAVAVLRGFSPRVHRGIKDFMNRTEDLPFDAAAALAVDRLTIGSMARRSDGGALAAPEMVSHVPSTDCSSARSAPKDPPHRPSPRPG